MIQAWKIPHIIKGMLTSVPVLNAWRLRRAATGGTDSPRYCYRVWLHHLLTLHHFDFRINGARVGELGPGDSIGIGLAALLSGAAHYVGLDIVPFSGRADLELIFDELVQLYSRREPIPEHDEFPDRLMDWTDFAKRAERIRRELETPLNGGQLVSYRAPWTSPDDLPLASLDLIFSHAALEHVDQLEETYRAMFAWLKPGGYASHVIDLSAHYLSPFWNGHWAYSDWEWRLVRGRREFLLNREPVNTHLTCANNAGFEVLLSRRAYDDHGLSAHSLSRPFRQLDAEDARTRGVTLILRKP